MKICPKCEAQNNDFAVICKDCDCSLSMVKIVDREENIKEIEKEKLMRHKRKIFIHNTVLSITGVFYIYFLVMGLRIEYHSEILLLAIVLPITSYLLIHHPRALFMLRHILTINNLDDVEISDLYIWCSKIIGLLFMIFAMGTLVAWYLYTI